MALSRMWRPWTFGTATCSNGFRQSKSIHARRHFHDYFVTHLPSSSLHPDSKSPARPSHKLPRDESTPHDHGPASRQPVAMVGMRDTTVVRIPLKSAKHHFGASNARGTRPYNEDTYQAGTIEIPAFAKRAPVSLRSGRAPAAERQNADGANGDPQVFYFGIFDGHGGDECSIFLREKLHEYIEDSAIKFEMPSSLKSEPAPKGRKATTSTSDEDGEASITEAERSQISPASEEAASTAPRSTEDVDDKDVDEADSDIIQDHPKSEDLEHELIHSWKDTVGGYFRRFKPEHFSSESGGQGKILYPSEVSKKGLEKISPSSRDPKVSGPAIDNVLTYAFLRADLDFVNKQAAKDEIPPPPQTPPPQQTSSHHDDRPINDHEHHHHRPGHQAPKPAPKPPSQFLGGSTCSIIMVSTPTASPFWHPASPSTLVVAHCGDTRILLSSTATGDAIPLTSDHHPSLPTEASRLRRYAGAFTTDSFGEERIFGLANTRAFGDMRSKRMGVSAEPELRLVHVRPAECAFLVLVTDGVSGTLSDQEIVDIVKEARTPEEAARAVTSFATEVGDGEKGDADNATCVVVRMGGWERRSEGGVGSLGTKEKRDWRIQQANSDPRGGRM